MDLEILLQSDPKQSGSFKKIQTKLDTEEEHVLVYFFLVLLVKLVMWPFAQNKAIRALQKFPLTEGINFEGTCR